MSGEDRRLEPLLEHPLRQALLASRGASSCLLVGGVIRDLLIFGRSGPDWDVIASGAPTFAARLAERLGARLVRLGGRRHSLFRVVTDEVQLDLQRPLASDLESELRRRDLTINSIALDLVTRALHDPLDGCGDIERRLLRAASEDAFTADPLRVVRLLRFAVTLPGFAIEERTADLARRAASELDSVAVERIRDELHRSLSVPRIPRLGGLLAVLGLLPGPWRLGEAGAVPTPVPDHGASLLDDLDTVIDETERRLGTRLDEPDLEALRHAAILEAAGSGVEPADAAAQLVEHGLLTRRLAARLGKLSRPAEAPDDEPSRRRLIHRWGRSWAAGVALQTWRASGTERERWRRAATPLAATVARAGETLFELAPLLSGNELQDELGLKPGRELGRLLAALEEAQIAGEISTPREARDWLRRRGAPPATGRP